ncbi:THAP domain-containing protein 5-like [Pelobates fuscus]|uniref:THAP domain-containing protein 5-like n=1 Tax=Pelobates fuscus TaxID=191477 RepID=UPI002FE44B71
MAKCCAIPECRRIGGKGENYHKFPLQDKGRLKQWLSNMYLENFVPSKKQYLCSKHFKPSCFQLKWGVRLLKPDAVPTMFPFTGGGSIKKHQPKVKTPQLSPNAKNEVCFLSLPGSNSETLPQSDVVETESLSFALDPNFSTGQVFIGDESLVKEIVIPNSIEGGVNFLPLVHIVESFDGLSLALRPQTQQLSSLTLPFSVTGNQQVHEIPLNQPISFITEEHIASTSLQHDLYTSDAMLPQEVPTIINVSNDGTLVIKDVSIDPFSESGFQTVVSEQMTPEELVAYLETMQTATSVPVLQSGPLPPLMPSPETVLSTSITAPISSIVPIVSKHAALISENLSEQESNVLEEQIELPENLTTPELLSMAADLQKKVRTLQQRNRRHTSKLEVLESVVEELKKENIISDEKLNFLEVACVQSNCVLPETSNTFTIVCQEDEQTLMYALPLQMENESQTLLLRSEEYDKVTSV